MPHALLAVFGFLSAASSADAEFRYWRNISGGAFGTPSMFSFNWSATELGAIGATVPSTNDVANFTLNNTYTVTFAQNVTNQRLLVLNGDVTFDLNGRTYLLTENFQAAIIGNVPGATGRLTITDGILDVDTSGDTIDVSFGAANTPGALTVSTGGRIGDGATNPTLVVGNSGHGTLTVESDGRVNAQDLVVGNNGAATASVTGSLARVTVDDETWVGSISGATLNVTSGADLTTDSMTLAFAPNESGAVLVSGTGSTISTTAGLRVGLHGSGTLIVEAGGAVTSGSTSYIGGNNGSQGDVTVTDAGSAWNINGDLRLAGLLDDAVVAGTLSIKNGASVALTGTGTLRIRPGGTINIDDGTLSMVAFDFRGGQVNFNSGTIAFTGPKTLASTELAALLGADRTLKHGRTLDVAGAATLTGALVVDGGTIAVGSLANQGTLVLRSGNLDVTGASGLNLGAAGLPTLVVPFGLGVNVANNLTVARGNHLIVTGGEVSAGSVTNSVGGRITLDGAAARLAATGPLGPTLANSGVLTGHGIVAANLTNNVGGEVSPLGDAGLVFTGTTNTNHGEIHLADGRIEFTAALTNSATGIIDGRGALVTGGITNNGVLALSGSFTDIYGDVTNSADARVVTSGGGVTTFYDDVAHNGTEIRTSNGSRSVFFGAVTGAGPFTGTGVAQMEGDLRPGSSPAIVTFGGDLEFGSLASLEMEIGGVSPGTQHDQINVAAAASFAGTLNVGLINGFAPTLPGQSFVIMNYGSHTGAFDVENLPANSALAGLGWTVTYTPTSLVLTTTPLLRGDIDLDGDVDRADAALFTPHLGLASGSVWTSGDFDGDAATTLEDLALLQSNFGATVPSPSGSLTAVAEPASLTWALIGAVGVLYTARSGNRRGRRSRATQA